MNCGPEAQNKPRGTHHPKVLSLGYRTHRLRPLLIEYCRRPNDRTHRDNILIHDSIFFCLALCPNRPMASDGQRHRRSSGLFRQNVSYMPLVGVACLGLGLGPVDGDNGALHLPAICPILATSAFHRAQKTSYGVRWTKTPPIFRLLSAERLLYASSRCGMPWFGPRARGWR